MSYKTKRGEGDGIGNESSLFSVPNWTKWGCTSWICTRVKEERGGVQQRIGWFPIIWSWLASLLFPPPSLIQCRLPPFSSPSHPYATHPCRIGTKCSLVLLSASRVLAE